MVDGIIQGVDKHLGVKKGSTRNFKYMRYRMARDTEQQFQKAWYAVSLTNVYGNGLSI